MAQQRFTSAIPSTLLGSLCRVERSTLRQLNNHFDLPATTDTTTDTTKDTPWAPRNLAMPP